MARKHYSMDMTVICTSWTGPGQGASWGDWRELLLSTKTLHNVASGKINPEEYARALFFVGQFARTARSRLDLRDNRAELGGYDVKRIVSAAETDGAKLIG